MHNTCSVKLDTLSSDSKTKDEANLLITASEAALRASIDTLWTMIIPRALRPVATPLLNRFPTKALKDYAVSRSQLFGAAMTLTKNAMHRLGVEFKDEIGMEKTFSE